jgi:hypothetical protein
MKISYLESSTRALCLAILIATGLCHGAELLILSSQLEQFLPSITQKIDAYRLQVAQITNFAEWEENEDALANKDAFAAFLGYQQWVQIPFEGGKKFKGYTKEQLEAIYDKIITNMQVVVIKSLWSKYEPNLEKIIKRIVTDKKVVTIKNFSEKSGELLSEVKDIVFRMRRDLDAMFLDKLSTVTKPDDTRAQAWQEVLVHAISIAIAIPTEWAHKTGKQALEKKDDKTLGEIFRQYSLALKGIEKMTTEMQQSLVPYNESKLYSSLSQEKAKQCIKQLFTKKVAIFKLWCTAIAFAFLEIHDVPKEVAKATRAFQLTAAQNLDEEAIQLARYLGTAKPNDDIYQKMLDDAARDGFSPT